MSQSSVDKSNKPNLRFYLLSCGYIRQYFTIKNVNPSDIGHIIKKFLKDDWEFDYLYDYLNRDPKTHGIENNGKLVKCITSEPCHYFFHHFYFQ